MTDRHPIVVVLADDLIWGTRLTGLVAEAGGEVRTARSLDAFGPLLPGAGMAVVDATARGYDPIAAVVAASHAGVRCVCVAQHDDAALRRAAVEAGAERVLPYRLLAERGAAIVGELLGRSEAER